MTKQNPHPDAVTDDDEKSNQAVIRQDSAGRYCVNDLHDVAGGSHKHDPSFYFELAETQELIMLLRREQSSTGIDPVVSPDGPDGLTFVSDDIAIDYTSWLSPQTRLALYGGFRAQRERFIGGETDIRSTAEIFEEAMVQAGESSERGGRSKPH
ncbi:hypothetical protein ASD22_11155 [Rhodanobacter sp. Root480]|uniref:KilA-N domain-containing protein n=1 Tax=Rhodanobacter sp. Root480 TaxID=1736542 RepID=UPI00072797EF|nr:KilA-N domain-containing protein [Rhodanobacter sp. Root480]KQX97768.1 hypothetical protein ASD22_11155 [Rhodanobacter sp. Root480]